MSFDHQFSPREKEVLELLLQGKSNKQIALELGISNRTVEFHLSNIYAKLGVNSRSEAILKLAEGQLRESTGDVQGKSTVEEADDSTENGVKPALRRIPLKKLFYVFGGLSVTVLIVFVTMLNLSKENLASSPTAPVEHTVAPSSDFNIQISTETSPAPLETIHAEPIVISSHTVNGYTAAVESYYIDISHVIFQVRLTGGDLNMGKEPIVNRLAHVDLYDEYGNLINSSAGIGPAVDPALIQFAFEPTTLLKEDRFKGQFAFDVSTGAPDYNTILAQFRFDFDLPIYPEVRFYPKQTVTANGLEMLLDSVTVTPVFTQIYLCFQPPSFAPWTIGSQTVLQMGEQEVPLYHSSELFSSATGSYWGTRSEPYWVPPVKNGSCHKIGFQAGINNPSALTLTIPELENLMAYGPDGNLLFQLPTIYPGMSEKSAFHTYLEENGYTYGGPWKFTVQLTP